MLDRSNLGPQCGIVLQSIARIMTSAMTVWAYCSNSVYSIRATVYEPINIMHLTTVRLNVEENQLVNVFGEFCVCVGSLKSA